MTKETAIEALSHCAVEHRCEDGIWGHCDGCNQRIALDMAIDALKQNQWIPCSERLPEVGEDVFISVGERVCEAHLRASGDYFLTHKIKELVRVRSVDAWMPLPKPYEGGETE